MDQLTGRGQLSLGLRGVLAVVLALVVAILMVLRGTGNLRQDAEITVGIPAAAGLVNGEAPVRYHGVNIGRIAAIDSGTDESLVRLRIESESLALVPDTVSARIVPRTFFGDIYLQLVDNPQARSGSSLEDGDRIAVDTGPEAVALYDVYTKLVDVLDRMQPQKVQTALTALGQALDGRGDTVGRIVSRLGEVSDVLSPSVQEFLESTPEFREVMESLERATPDIVATLAAATSVSHSIVAHQDGLAATLAASAGFAAVLSPFFGDNREQLITVLDATGEILATTAADPEGLVETLDKARTFGAAGGRVFATGRFDITAVPSFADPLPYGPSDCPRYGGLSNPMCGAFGGSEASANARPAGSSPGVPAPAGGPERAQPEIGDVVDGAAESPVLRFLEEQLGVGNPGVGSPGIGTPDGVAAPASVDAGAPNPATVVMLGPLVRGKQVTVR
ncbi:MCE family protein [Rhodococcus triatomae]|uniref:Virulence factor Mce family protein n=1 Tax=Rhodococcus triatomae TaxID=300028 RepID=A0A1G8RD78_9NOCA|nr:MCE family protein [Rhodococcus triatomae]QNG19647.1 MCE family protein [Rhodococcus triatomae]QNG24438.1 MCE family protein [Rhodococcus triatomae]SDJ15004.1 virulence factor Mce family protein [Rhodococcus triatomae]